MSDAVFELLRHFWRNYVALLILIGFQSFWSNKQNGEVLKTNHCLQENYFALHYYEMGRTPKYYVYAISRKIFHFIIFVVKSFKQYQKKQVDNIPNLASIQSVAFRWALPGAAKCSWPKKFFKLNVRFLN